MSRLACRLGAFASTLLCSAWVHAAPAEPAGTPDAEAAAAPEDRAYVGPGAVQAEAGEAGSVGVVAGGEGPGGGMDSIAFSERPAPPKPLRHRLVYKNLLALRYNPLGLVDDFNIGWRLQLFMKPGALFEDSFFAVKLRTFTNPAFAQVGPRIELQPLAILNLSATYQWAGFFSTFDQLMSFPTPTAPHEDDTLDELGAAGRNYVTTGHMLMLAALLQAKVRKIAVRSYLRFHYTDLDLKNGDRVWYGQTLDILHPDAGWVVVNDADLLYLFDFGLKVAARHTVTHAFYQPKHFLPGEPQSRPNSPTHRIGPAFLYTFYDKPERRFNKPTVFLLTQWWAQHRYRTGADVSAGIPYLAIGFLFEGDLLPNPRKRAKKK